MSQLLQRPLPALPDPPNDSHVPVSASGAGLGASGQAFKRLAPAALLVPGAFGALHLFLERNGLLIGAQAIALTTALTTVLMVAVTRWICTRLGHLEAERHLRGVALEHSTALLDAIFARTADAISVLDADHQLVAYNATYVAAFTSLVGHPPAVGMCLDEALADVPGLLDQVRPNWARAAAGETFRAELRSGALTPRFRVLEVTYGPVGTQDGDRTGTVQIFRDVTDRAQNEQLQHELSTRLLEAQRLASVGWWEYDLITKQAYWTEEVFRIFERPPALGAPDVAAFQASVAADDRARVIAASEAAIAAGEDLRYTCRIDVPSGLERYVTIVLRPIRGEGGAITKVVGTVQDVSNITLALHEIQRLLAERDQAQVERERQGARLDAAMHDVLRAIVTTMEVRDPYTAGHQQRVADLSAAIARQLGMAEDRIHGLHLAAMVHDIGKIQVPQEILARPGRLSAIEFALIKYHPQVGYDILKGIDFPWPIAEIVYQHHERLDGAGYPRGLTGDAILPEARILAIADTVEAMASHRPYRAGLGIDVALAEIRAGRGARYDADAVDACLEVFARGYVFSD